MSEQPAVSSTALELEVDAMCATLGAWCYPSDFEIRCTAETACRLVGVNYIESLARIVAADDTITADDARQRVAIGFLPRIAKIVKWGGTPRAGICATGEPADDMGYPIKLEEQE